MAEMDRVTQQNAANSEESASSAEELSSQAEEMRRMVAEFELTAGKLADSGDVATVKQEIQHHDFAKPAPTPRPKNRIKEIAKSGNGDGAKAKAAKAVEPELIIPMDAEDFADF